MQADTAWQRQYEKYKSITLPENLCKLPNATTKKEQIKLLEGLSIDNEEFTSFIIMAHEKHDFLYSVYMAHHNQKGLDEIKLPKLMHLQDNGDLVKIVNTELPDGQLK
jgi:hypothetical protein